MTHLPMTPRSVAPYVIGGATGVHILTRMHRLSRQPELDIPLHLFLLRNSDVLLALSGTSIAIWHLAKYRPRQQTSGNMTTTDANGFAVSPSEKSLIAGIVHELRQVFTALLLGLGLIERKADSDNTQAIPAMVRRLMGVVRSGIDAVDVLDSKNSTNGHEKEYGA